MQTIVLAPDKFKGSISAIEFCEAVERGIKKHLEQVKIIKLPLADGGDGTLDVLNYYLKGEMVSVKVHNPLFQKIEASYLLSRPKKTAYIEMSRASGICLLKNQELNPLETSTYGTGELIVDALNKGVQHILLGIGGSATNDAGLGMAKALGFQLFDLNHQPLAGCGKDLERLAHISDAQVHPLLHGVTIDVACDVYNSLYGTNGAAYIYAPQKGASPEMAAQLDAGLRNFNTVAKSSFKKDLNNIAGAGAAGGLGAGSILFLHARLQSGIELIKSEAHFDQKIKDADWIITGEGKLDEQSFSGKVITGVTKSITNQQLAIFCGISELKKESLAHLKICYLKKIIECADSRDDSIKNATYYLQKSAEEFAKTVLKE